MSMAEFMSKGVATVPRHLQKNASDCLAIIMQAVQWKMNPFAVAQKTHLVSGTLGYEAQLVNAVINSLAPTKDRIHYEWFGDWDKVIGKFKEVTSKKKVNEDTGEPQKYRVPNWTIDDEKGLGVRVWATLRGESEPRELTLLLSQCRVRNSTLWADDPRQQIAYLAVKRWARLYCPDVILGVYSADELSDYSQEIDVTGRSERVEDEKPDPVSTTITKEQIGQIIHALPAAGMEVEDFCKMARVDALHDLQQARFEAAMNYVKRRTEALQASEQAQPSDQEAEAQ
ncbi:MAG: recombinase RecT [Gammaproteobacteria bacterium]|nr:recombinase RecT [Gammaproteobacteria bacterium]MBJ54720.1 recombinase RecT [Gammaproteobacteria bacterium]HBN16149.1 recombinase RecT [Pseudohongiella sp.]